MAAQADGPRWGSRKRSVLGVLVDPIDPDVAVAEVLQAAIEGQGLSVTALAAHGVLTAVRDSRYRYRLNALDLVLPDGQPVRWTLNLLHRARVRKRVYGPALMATLLERAEAEGLPVYFYGSRPETLGSLIARTRARFPRLAIAGVEPSRFRRVSAPEFEEIARAVRDSNARMVFIGLGCPRQEVFAHELGNHVDAPVIAVGAAFDYHAGAQPYPPPSLQRLGLEWLWRLAHEPRRLWRRYAANPLFVCLVMLQGLNLWRPDTKGAPVGRGRGLEA